MKDSKRASGLDFKGLNIKKSAYDQFIIEKSDDPNAMPMLADEITERIDADVIGSHRFDPGAYSGIRTQRATRHDDSVKHMLLNASKKEPPPAAGDDRPLIDKLHEATFTEPIGLQWIEDKYALRMMLRKAHCFTLDQVTSSLVGDFSIAIASDLEVARRMAIPPYPVTWIDIDNRARLARMKALGVRLTDQAETDSVLRVGWLIHPDTANGGYYAHYCCETDQSIQLAPLAYWWHTEASQTGKLRPEVAEQLDIAYMDRLSFGLKGSGVNPSDAIPSPTPMHIERMRGPKYPPQVKELMVEIGGELRHIWGFLIALGAGQLGMEARYSDQPKPDRAPPIMKNGKPLLPIEHKVLHLHLAKKMTVAKVIARSVTKHKHRWHEVRSHFRLLKSGARVPVKAHERGDERLGRVEKTYRVKR